MSVASIVVDIDAILHNIGVFRKIAPNSELIAVVKANAYAHGKTVLAQQICHHVDGFAVARLDEAIQLINALKKVGKTKRIILLEGFFIHDNLNDLIKYGFETVIHSSWQIDALKQMADKEKITTWFKIDTGMHRLGFNPADASHCFSQLLSCNVVKKPVHILSHFCCADEITSNKTIEQMAIFDQFIDSIKDKTTIGKQSIAASAGLLAWSDARRDVVRPGISLYGVSPFEYPQTDFDLKPAMTFKSELIAIRTHQQGESVGYGQTWQSPNDTILGVVAMGYGDGYPRNIPHNTPVLINGRKVPIVGRVSMDMIVVDLGLASQDKLGDEVIFWGNELPVEEIAAHTKISAYELLTRLTARANISYINKQA